MFEDIEEVKPDGEQPLKFYYNREHRLENAPKIVRDYYDGKMKPVRGFRALFNKQNKFVFFALIIIVAFGWATTGISKAKTYSQLAGINVELNAFAYEDEVYASVRLKRSSKSKDLAPKMVNAQIEVIDPNKNVSERQSLSCIYNEGEQFIRAKFTDYDIIRVDVLLTVGDEEKQISAEVKR